MVLALSLSLSRQAKTLLLVSFLATFSESMLVPVYAVFTERAGGSVLDAGIAYALFSVATGAAVVAVGSRAWLERFLREIIAVGFFVSALCDVFYVFVHGRWQLFAVQVLAGLAMGLVEPAWDALYSDVIEHSAFQHWSIWTGGVHFVTGAASVLGGIVVSCTSFEVLFLLMALLDLAAVAVALRAKPEPGRKVAGAQAELAARPTSPSSAAEEAGPSAGSRVP